MRGNVTYCCDMRVRHQAELCAAVLALINADLWVHVCNRSSELEIARQDILTWMCGQFPQDTGWQEIRTGVNDVYPALYAKYAKISDPICMVALHLGSKRHMIGTDLHKTAISGAVSCTYFLLRHTRRFCADLVIGWNANLVD